MNITLPPEWAQFVTQMVESGRYDFPEEVVCLGLHLLKNWEDLRTIRDEELRKEVAIGLEQAERGEVAPLDMQAILAKSRERLAALRNNTHAASPANQPSRG